MAWYHRIAARLLGTVPWLQERFTVRTAGGIPGEVPAAPWTSVSVDPGSARLMLATTGGVHRPDQDPFDMSDSRGDSSYRWIPRQQATFRITHDYYDHRGADRDVNCLFPLELGRRLSESGLIGPLTERHLSFMGHIEDPLVPVLMEESLPAMWEELEDRPGLVLLSPG